MIPLTPLQIKLAIGAVICLVLSLGGYYMGYSHEHQKFEAFKEKVAVAGKEQEDKTKKIDETHQNTLNEVKNDYENRLSALHTYYGGLLNNSSSSKLSKTTSSSNGINERPTDNVSAEQCAETTLMFVTLRDLVIKWQKEQDALQ